MAGEKNRAMWWQFRLSTVTLLTALIAMAIAWWLDHDRLERRLLEAELRIQFLETSTYFDGNLMQLPAAR